MKNLYLFYRPIVLYILTISFSLLEIQNALAQQLWHGAPAPKSGSGTLIRSNKSNMSQPKLSTSTHNNPIMDGVCSLPAFNPCIPEATCVPSVPIIGDALCQCPSGYSGDGRKDGVGCVNIDECRTGTHNCDMETMDCFDLQGTFECLCKKGYDLAPSGKICLDIDECHDPSLNTCDSETMTCRNLQGSYQCDCKNPNQIKDESTKKCRDLDECNDMDGAMNPCEQICINRSPGVECACNMGFRLAIDQRTCEDINECIDPYLHACDPSGMISNCVNTRGGYFCDCNNELGYRNSGDGYSCKNFNECEEYPYICGGARSCCKDLSPPDRFACIIPGDANIQAITSELTEAGYVVPFGDISNVITDTLQTISPIFGMEASPRNLSDEAISAYTGVKALVARNMELSKVYYITNQFFSSEPRSLQLLPSLFTSGPLQINNKARQGSSSIIPTNLGGLRTMRGNTCPEGFMMGADLQRARTRKAAMNAVQSAFISNTRDEYGNQRPVNPEELTDSFVKNTAVVSNELQKWITELSSVPQEVAAAAGPLSSPLDPQRQNVPIGNSAISGGNFLGLNAEDLAALLIGGGIGKLIECDPANDPFCDRTGRSTKLAYGSG